MRGRAIARPSCDYIVDFDDDAGGNVDDIDEIVGKDVALHFIFSKFRNSGVNSDLSGHFLTPSRVESILKFWLDTTTNG